MNKKDLVTFARMIRAQRHQARLLTPDESRNRVKELIIKYESLLDDITLQRIGA